MKPAVSIQNVSKMYRIGARQNGGYRTFRETLSEAVAAPLRRVRELCGKEPPVIDAEAETHWALRDVSFDIAPGEVAGVIGRNGAGKSTLLKVLSSITEPTSGRVELRGRICSLLEVGTGFHHELTGRENIYLNGAIFGMSRQEIARKFDDIIAFSEVEDFLDTPVKRYSSGMFVRLAFAVASHIDTEILLVDEVLAVGDAAFQKKCLGKMREVGRSGRTVFFVSHNMATILNLCDKAIVLNRGRLAFAGGCEEGVGHYMQDQESCHESVVDLQHHPNRRVGCKTILSKIRLLNGHGHPATEFLSGEPVRVELWADTAAPVHKPAIAVGIEDAFGCRVFTVATYLTEQPPEVLTKQHRIVCELGELPLVQGRYALSLNCGPLGAAWTDAVDQVLWFDVVPSDYFGNGKISCADWGRYLVRSRWSLADA